MGRDGCAAAAGRARRAEPRPGTEELRRLQLLEQLLADGDLECERAEGEPGHDRLDTCRLRANGRQDADQVTASQADLAREYKHGADAGQPGRASDAGRRALSRCPRSTAHGTQRPAPQTASRDASRARWHAGYDAGGDSSEGLLRDLERKLASRWQPNRQTTVSTSAG